MTPQRLAEIRGLIAQAGDGWWPRVAGELIDEVDRLTAGTPLTIQQATEIHEAYQFRRSTFDESSEMSMAVVLLNYGARFAPVSCIAGEWAGTKEQLQPSHGVPVCPNGHVLIEGPGMKLGLIPEDGA